MVSPVSRAPTVISPEHHPPTKGTLIFSYTCVALTGTAIIVVLVIFCRYRVRHRAPVAAGGGAAEDVNATERHQVGVDIAKLPEFAYTELARRSGGEAQCKHLYHVECIDMWLASHKTCPLCRADVEPQVDDDSQDASAGHDRAPPV